MTQGYNTAAQTVHTNRWPGSYCRPACWTLNPGLGQSYCSFNSHINLNSALMKYTLRDGGWTHSMNLYLNIKICFHRILEQLVGTTNYFVCIYVSEIYLETSCKSVLRSYKDHPMVQWYVLNSDLCAVLLFAKNAFTLAISKYNKLSTVGFVKNLLLRKRNTKQL